MPCPLQSPFPSAWFPVAAVSVPALRVSVCVSLSPEEAPRGRCRELQVTLSPEVLDLSELQPLPRPECALAEALALLADHDWCVQGVLGSWKTRHDWCHGKNCEREGTKTGGVSQI